MSLLPPAPPECPLSYQDPPSLLVARQVVATLLAEGVGEAVLCPGSRSAPLALALAEAAEAGHLRLRVVLDERGAGFIAVGMARAHALDGWLAPAAVVTTSGTAVPNLHPAACEADAAGIPLLLVCADRPHELVGTGANQTTQQATLLGGTVRGVIDVPADLLASQPGGLGREAGLAAVAGQVRRGVAAATGTVTRDPGPVLVNVRLRPPLAPAGPWSAGQPGAATAARPGARVVGGPGSAAWSQAVLRQPAPVAGATPPGGPEGQAGAAGAPTAPGVGGARGPGEALGLVVAGDTPYPGTGRLARALAETLGWPLLAEPTSQARGGGCALVRYAELLATRAGQGLASQVRHVVVAGHPSLSRAVTALLGRGDIEVTVLAERARWTDVAGTARAVVPVDPFQGAGQVDGLVAARGLAPAGEDWLRSWHRAVSGLPPVPGPAAGGRGGGGGAGGPGAAGGDGAAGAAGALGGLGAVGAAEEVATAVWREALRPGAPLLVVGSSTTVRRLDRLAPAASQDRIPQAVANRGLAGIDGTVATAVGLALGSGAPVRAVMGDLTFLHDAMSLGRGRAEAEPDLQVVVLDDSGGSIFRELEYAAVVRSAEMDRLFAAPQQVDIPALARAAGACVHVPADLAQLRDVLAQPVRGVSVVVVQLAGAASGRAVTPVSSESVTG